MSKPEVTLPDAVIGLDKMLDRRREDAHYAPNSPNAERRDAEIEVLDAAVFYLRSMSTKLASP